MQYTDKQVPLLENIGKYETIFSFLKVSQSRLEHIIKKKQSSTKKLVKFHIEAGIKCHNVGSSSLYWKKAIKMASIYTGLKEGVMLIGT